MTEIAPSQPNPEAGRHEVLMDAEHLLPTHEQAQKVHEAERQHAEAGVEARTKVQESIDETQSSPLEKLKAAENAAPAPSRQEIGKDARQAALYRQFKDIRRKLNPADRALSRVVHQPIVRAVSEGAGKTVSRPSGLLGGGLVALIGTSGYLYMAKHLGFEYNYFVFLALFFSGFIIGLILEVVVHVATASRRHNQA